MLEKLGQVELAGFLKGLEAYTSEVSPTFDGCPVLEVLDYIINTPNEWDREPEWVEFVADVPGQEHDAARAVLIASIVVDAGGDGGPSAYGVLDLAEILLAD